MSWGGAILKPFLSIWQWYRGRHGWKYPRITGRNGQETIDRKVGTMSGLISKQLIYGDQQIPETKIKIERIREAMNDFLRQKAEIRKLAKKNGRRGA